MTLTLKVYYKQCSTFILILIHPVPSTSLMIAKRQKQYSVCIFFKKVTLICKEQWSRDYRISVESDGEVITWNLFFCMIHKASIKATKMEKMKETENIDICAFQDWSNTNQGITRASSIDPVKVQECNAKRELGSVRHDGAPMNFLKKSTYCHWSHQFI